MKNLLKISTSVLLLAFTCCTNPKDSNEQKPNTPMILLTADQRAHAVVTWNDFISSSNEALNTTQNKIDSLRAKIYLTQARQKVKIRRIINKTEYKLEKLRKELYDNDAWFRIHINTYTNKDDAKISAFKKHIENELTDINAELDSCNC